MFNLRKFSPRTFDWWLFVSAVLLVALGLAAIYSIDLSRGSTLTYFKKQALAAGIGITLLLFISMFQHTVWRYSAKWWYGASLVILTAVLIFGKTIRGTTGWFTMAGFSFQPVEVAKVSIVLMLAAIIARFGSEFKRPLFFFGTGIFTFLLFALVMMQPDLGSALLLGMVWFGLMWLVGARKLYMGLFIAIVLVIGTLGWMFFMEDYQRARIATFINPEKDPLGSGYNITQSIIAVGAGKWFGSQSQLRFLPEAQTDFIFSVIAEELGLAGVVVLLTLFGVLFFRLLSLAAEAKDSFHAAAISGALVLIFSQFFINIGAGIGILPITGVTLPFVSYGGSSLVMSMAFIGIIESMIARRY